jgi:TfoX/Sxy family transcriptional regulator of competence genes
VTAKPVRGADPDYIAELFSQFGPVTVRRMFSGAGIFADGLMIALVVDGVIFLKADAEIVPRFESEGLPAFSYKTKEGRRTLIVLAHAGAALRRSGRACRLGEEVDGCGATVKRAEAAREVGQARNEASP